MYFGIKGLICIEVDHRCRHGLGSKPLKCAIIAIGHIGASLASHRHMFTFPSNSLVEDVYYSAREYACLLANESHPDLQKLPTCRFKCIFKI